MTTLGSSATTAGLFMLVFFVVTLGFGELKEPWGERSFAVGLCGMLVCSIALLVCAVLAIWGVK